MPIYEYQCEQCGRVSSFFEKSMRANTSHECPECGSRELRKLCSAFSAGRGEAGASGSDACPTGNCPFA